MQVVLPNYHLLAKTAGAACKLGWQYCFSPLIKLRTGPLRSFLSSLVFGIAAFALCSCSMMRGSEKDAAKRAEQLQELQLKVMRFADEYAGGVIEPVQRFQVATDNAEDRLIAQNWKLSQSTAAYTIASGPNPVINAVDMVVLATLSRMVIEDAWVGEKFGERALPFQEAHRRLEARARELVADVLTADQIIQLQRIMDDWRERNPNIRAVSYVHFNDFAKSIGRPQPGEVGTKGGLFALLGLDPLSQLDPAVRELTQTRQLAERTIYYAQRAANLLDMQVERLSYQIAAMPETKRMLADADRFGVAATATGQLADELPNILAREREAAIHQFMEGIAKDTMQTRALITDLRGTLEAGTATSDSLNATIRSLDQIIGRFDKPKPAAGAPTEPPSRPFDITEYTAAAAEFARTANELQKLLAGIEHGTPVLMQSADHAASNLQAVADHILWRTLLIGVLLIAGGFVSALAYRFIARRWLV
jgi:hypothetical protein